MITDALLRFLLTVLGLFWGLLPAWSPVADPATYGLVRNYYYQFDTWAPVHEIVWVMGIMFAIWGGMVAFKFVVKMLDWIADIIP